MKENIVLSQNLPYLDFATLSGAMLFDVRRSVRTVNANGTGGMPAYGDLMGRIYDCVGGTIHAKATDNASRPTCYANGLLVGASQSLQIVGASALSPPYTVMASGTWNGSDPVHVADLAGDDKFRVGGDGSILLADNAASSVQTGGFLTAGSFLVLVSVAANGTPTIYFTRNVAEVPGAMLGTTTFDTIASDNNVSSRIFAFGTATQSITAAQSSALGLYDEAYGGLGL